MDELTNRSRTFAEAVVTMVWQVLLALALKPKWKSEVPFLAGSTIITGICPLLACCIFNNPRATSGIAAFISAVMLFILACRISSFTGSGEVIVFWVAVVFIACMVFRLSSYYSETGRHGHPTRNREFHTILDGSHEFSCCMTGIHFLWLESLVLGGLVNRSHGIQIAQSEVMGIASILCCAIGLCAMYIEMTPPPTSITMDDIAGPILWFGAFMISSIGTVLGAAMWKSSGFPGLLLIIVGPLMVAFIHMLHIGCPEETWGRRDEEPPKLAPLGLTKLMVTGFLTVSISVDSPDVGITNWFLVSAAAAIVSGLSWRLLTQAQVSKVLENNNPARVSQENNNPARVSQESIDKTAAVASSANVACFFAHAFVAIATILLILEICNVKQLTSAAAPAPAPART